MLIQSIEEQFFNTDHIQIMAVEFTDDGEGQQSPVFHVVVQVASGEAHFLADGLSSEEANFLSAAVAYHWATGNTRLLKMSTLRRQFAQGVRLSQDESDGA